MVPSESRRNTIFCQNAYSSSRLETSMMTRGQIDNLTPGQSRDEPETPSIRWLWKLRCILSIKGNCSTSENVHFLISLNRIMA